MQVKIDDNGKLSVPSFAVNHLKHFNNIIGNITISSFNYKKDKATKLTNLTSFMLTKCAQRLRKICIIGDMELTQFGQNISNILSNVTTVKFGNRGGSVDEAKFLSLCPNLKILILGTEINRKNVNAILKQRYHKLTKFCYLYDNGNNLNPENLQKFFRINQMEHFVWTPRIDDSCRNNFVKCFEAIGFAEHLTHFRLCFSNQLQKFTIHDFNYMYDELNQLCNRESFQVLEIELIAGLFSKDPPDDNRTLFSRLRLFGNLRKLAKIHFHRFGILTTMPVIRELIYVRSVVFERCPLKRLQRRPERKRFGEAIFEESNNGLDDYVTMEAPHIREVTINNDDRDLTNVCLPLVRHWRNLETIFAPVGKYGVCAVDVAELNEARKELMDACELTIISKYKCEKQDCEMVKLRSNLNR